MATFQREVQVSKTEAYELDVANWAGGEAILALSVIEASGNATVVSSEISGALLQVLVTGAVEGNATLHFEYSTTTRSKCTTATVRVIADC